jgi:serine/threonine protein kinase
MSTPELVLPLLPSWVKTSDPNLDFQILETIGKGGFGTVFKAAHRDTQQLVAVKRISLAEFGDDVQTELAVQKECNHDCIVNFVCSYCWEGDLWIAMECVEAAPYSMCFLFEDRYCSGGSLSDIFGALQQPLTEEEIAWVCLSCARGLEYMHSQRKIHRDIKVRYVLQTKNLPFFLIRLTARAVCEYHGHC